MISIRIHRRKFLLASAASSLPIARMKGNGTTSDPWSKSELIEPADFVKWLGAEEKPFHTICVTFPVLYRQKHIPHAQLAGPTNKPEAKRGSLHVKCVVADSERLFVSSANLTDQALRLNMELGILVTGKRCARDVEGHFSELLARQVLTRLE